MNTWFTKEFDRDDLQEFGIFGEGQLGRGICLGILWPLDLMNRVGAEGFKKILSFLEEGRHFLTLHLVLVCNLVDDELGITIDL